MKRTTTVFLTFLFLMGCQHIDNPSTPIDNPSTPVLTPEEEIAQNETIKSASEFFTTRDETGYPTGLYGIDAQGNTSKVELASISVPYIVGRIGDWIFIKSVAGITTTEEFNALPYYGINSKTGVSFKLPVIADLNFSTIIGDIVYAYTDNNDGATWFEINMRTGSKMQRTLAGAPTNMVVLSNGTLLSSEYLGNATYENNYWTKEDITPKTAAFSTDFKSWEMYRASDGTVSMIQNAVFVLDGFVDGELYLYKYTISSTGEPIETKTRIQEDDYFSFYPLLNYSENEANRKYYSDDNDIVKIVTVDFSKVTPTIFPSLIANFNSSYGSPIGMIGNNLVFQITDANNNYILMTLDMTTSAETFLANLGSTGYPRVKVVGNYVFYSMTDSATNKSKVYKQGLTGPTVVVSESGDLL